MAAKPYNKALFAFSFGNNSEAIADTLDEIIIAYEKSYSDLSLDFILDKGVIDFLSTSPLTSKNRNDMIWHDGLDN